MKFEYFVTDYDDSLSGDSYIDPLGVLVIWSAFGRRIFKDRVNSISNDVRNYTINLLNHALIRSIIEDDSVTLSEHLENHIGNKNSLSFRQACLIYLENLITYCLVSQPGTDVDSGGILGGSKARRKLDEGSDPWLTLSHHSDYFLLVRQLGLGVSGRYKTPFMQLDLFDARYNYRHKALADERWQAALTIFNQAPELEQLYKHCREHLVDLIDSAGRKSKLPPRAALSDLSSELRRSCCQALATQQRVGAATKDVWLSLTGLDQGAAGALYRAIEQAGDSKVSKQELFKRAESLCGSPQDKELLRDIQILEPFLAEADLLFTLCCTKRSQTLASVEEQWQELGRDTHTLPLLAQAIEGEHGINSVLTGTACRRFRRLIQMGCRQSVSEQVRALLDYHKSVMQGRGQLPWVTISAMGQLTLQVRQMNKPDPEKRPQGHWVNSYYIPQFRNLVSGLQGEM